MNDSQLDPRLIEKTSRHLNDIPDLYADSFYFREPGSTPPDPDARKGTSNPSRPTVALDVVDLQDERWKEFSDEPGERSATLDKIAGQRRMGVLPTLSNWVIKIRGELLDEGRSPERCCQGSEDHTVVGECAWLAQHVTDALELHSDFAADIEWLHRDLSRVSGVRPPLPLRCSMCGWRVVPADETESWYRCTGCEKTWRMDAELRRLGATQPPMPLVAVARAVGVKVGVLEEWRRRGLIAPVEFDRRSHLARYDVDVVRGVVESQPKGRPGRPRTASA